jgi:branched-subunit amino acid aminotransferase/4-amino-4-deoxychorismate lyase
MAYRYFSHNGDVLPIEHAVVPLSSVEYSYGFGVYETIRLANGKIQFLPEHCDRLLRSAKIIDLGHKFSADFVQNSARELIRQNEVATCNIKILLIGGQKPDLYILCLNPLFSDRKLYKTGAACATYQYERDFPQAKTLNMLPSYLAYRQAKAAGAYEALLINRRGHITEGTRSNFFAIKDRAIISPPSEDILPGVTRAHVLQTAEQNGFEIMEQDIKLAEIDQYDGAFLTSTAGKIIPINKIDVQPMNYPGTVKELMRLFDQFLAGLTI